MVYALVVALSLVCWTTPSRETKILSGSDGIADKLNAVVDPSPVKLSSLISWASKLSTVFDIMLPQKISFTFGAVWNIIVLPSFTAKPYVNDRGFRFGLWT